MPITASMMGFQWCALCMIIACGERPPSEACVHLSAQGLFDEAKWILMAARAFEIANQMHENNRSFMLTSELGEYEGAEAVREYITFISPQSVSMERSPVIKPQTGTGMVLEYDSTVVAPDGEVSSHTMCSRNPTSFYALAGNNSMMVDTLNYDAFTTETIAMLPYEVSLTDMKFHSVWV